jgi:hypothetical protein
MGWTGLSKSLAPTNCYCLTLNVQGVIRSIKFLPAPMAQVLRMHSLSALCIYICFLILNAILCLLRYSRIDNVNINDKMHISVSIYLSGQLCLYVIQHARAFVGFLLFVCCWVYVRCWSPLDSWLLIQCSTCRWNRYYGLDIDVIPICKQLTKSADHTLED